MLLSILKGVYFLTATSGLFYFLSRKRYFDHISLAFFSSIIYFLPLFFGYAGGQNPKTFEPLHDFVYAVGILVLASLIFTSEFLLKTTPKQHFQNAPSIKYSHKGKITIIILAIFASLGLFGTCLTTGSKLLVTDKAFLMEGLNRYHILMAFSSVLGVVWSFILKKKIYVIFFTFILLFDIFIGFRSSAAIAFLSIASIWLFNQGKIRLASIVWKFKRHSLLLLFGIIFFFIYKQLYILVKLGHWELIFLKLTNIQTYQQSITNSEPFSTQAILNEVFISNFSTDWRYLLNNFFQIIPFSNVFLKKTYSFNQMFQPVLFPQYTSELAGNWWAEWYAAFGLGGLGLSLLFYANGVLLSSYLLIRYAGKTHFRVLLTISGTLFSFYIHRNEIGYLITLEKRVLWLWLFALLLTTLLTGAASWRNRF